MTAPLPDRDAILVSLQDQIDDLTAAVTDLHKVIDAHNNVVIELARLAGLGASNPAATTNAAAVLSSDTAGPTTGEGP